MNAARLAPPTNFETKVLLGSHIAVHALWLDREDGNPVGN